MTREGGRAPGRAPTAAGVRGQRRTPQQTPTQTEAGAPRALIGRSAAPRPAQPGANRRPRIQPAPLGASAREWPGGAGGRDHGGRAGSRAPRGAGSLRPAALKRPETWNCGKIRPFPSDPYVREVARARGCSCLHDLLLLWVDKNQVRLMQSTEDLNSSKRLNKRELFLPESLSQRIHLLLPSNCYVHQPSWFSSLPTSQPPSPPR
ncbi:unnamed protein product [Nyctereutes procyonoides]|uniref:(raccoon dog) hypothetical protein n=1 Tax=Nyctereutes procyonoides TaxID=34880 RepID=A0A811ZY78_NYCPR|nr:unnamed protein product [Nyctereutes procyonoides]